MLTKTPKQAEGPFYPDKLPLDTDNDLILINDSLTPGVGEVTHFSGSVKTPAGSPVRNALVEIWQADTDGNYIHSKSRGGGNRDKNFQGYGRFLTGATGEYYFRCLKPTPYTRRAPHIHVAVSVKGKRVLTTQCYDSSYEGNKDDFLLNRAPADLRRLLIVDFQPLPGSETGELTARFDMVIGLTPQD
jgi:protocatechuate 3,4-dioxygenase beta subunit